MLRASLAFRQQQQQPRISLHDGVGPRLRPEQRRYLRWKKPGRMPHAVFMSQRRSSSHNHTLPTHDDQGRILLHERDTHIVGYIGPSGLSRDMTARERRVSKLADHVFSMGNRFIKNCTELREIPIGKLSFPEVMLAGHTNSGKSTLVGTLLQNRRLGRPGVLMGSTKGLGFFSVGDSFMIVDTPGYGHWDRAYGFKAVHRGVGQALTKQYASLRKHTNLKRVYLCIAADVGVNERDRDFVRFLLGEAIPFTVVMTQLDTLALQETRFASDFNWKGVASQIPAAAQRIFDGLGTDQLPFIEVCSRNSFNIEALRKDMVFQCCQELGDDPREINIHNFQQLSYSPASAAAYIEAETKYPPHLEIQVSDPNQPLLEFVERHKEQLKLDSESMQRVLGRYSLFDFARQAAPGSGPAFFEVDRDGRETAPLARPLSDEERTAVVTAPDVVPSLPAPEPKSAALADSSVKSIASSDDSSKSVIFYGAAVNRKDLVDSGASESVKGAVAAASAAVPPSRLQRPTSSATLLVDPVANPSKFDALDNMAAPQPAVPLSLTQDSVVDVLSKIEQSPYRYKKLIDNGWETVINSDTQFFTEDETQLQARRARGSRITTRKQILDRYVEKKGLQKERALKLNAHGYWCPFVGDLSASGSSVMGATPSSLVGVSTRGVNRGGRMLGLKQRGYGGGSHAPHTFKNRGRSSYKLEKWAR